MTSFDEHMKEYNKELDSYDLEQLLAASDRECEYVKWLLKQDPSTFKSTRDPKDIREYSNWMN